MSRPQYDFIIVGSGPAGSLLANRLANTKAHPSVLLLEAGPAAEPSNTNYLSDRFMSFMAHPNLNWQYKTVPQTHLNNRVLDYSRGRGLGGSTAINFAAYTVGPKDDYDRWAELVVDDFFNWENSVRRRKTFENYTFDVKDKQYQKYYQPEKSLHGEDGELYVSVPDVWEDSMTTLLDAAEGVEGMGICKDINDGVAFGLGAVPATAKAGRRETAATAFLKDVPKNLEIVSETIVQKVLFEGTRAVGVLTNNGEFHATKEIILSAGAIDTPKILMLSGIGDKSELESHGITSLIHLPGVGKNLQDHPFFAMDWIMDSSFHDRAPTLSNPDALACAQKEFSEKGTGPLSIMFNSMGMGYFRNDSLFSNDSYRALSQTEQEYLAKPTIPLWEIVTMAPCLNPTADPSKTILTILYFLHGVQSKGSIQLASADWKDAPLCDPNFLASPFDKANALASARKLLEFVDAKGVKEHVLSTFNVPAGNSDDDVMAWCRDFGVATWHPSCTTKMGRQGEQEGGACVDTNFRVFGTEGLRVADMSVTPFMFSCHTQSIAYFVGASAAEKLIGEYGLDGNVA